MLSFAVALCLSLPLVSARLGLWPQPVHAESGHDAIWVVAGLHATLRCGNGSQTAAFSQRQSQYAILSTLGEWQQTILQYTGRGEQSQTQEPLPESEVLRAAVRASINHIHRSRFVPWKFHSKGSAFEPDETASNLSLTALEISQTSCPSSTFEPNAFFQEDETYEIRIDNSTAYIKANSTIGSIRALETFKQLFYTHKATGRVYSPHIPVLIRDEPRWKYRGLSLGIARNPFSVEDVTRTIRAMASVKLNKLHLHATDSQAWPLDIPSLPDLATKGAYQPNLVWSATDLRRVQNYGISKGVEVILELDMPGHTASIAHAYPDLIAGFNQLDWSTFALEPLSGQLKLNSSRVDDFLDTLFDDLLPRQKPFTAAYHLGGDEVNLQIHLLDETVRSNSHEALQPLMQLFMQRLYDKAVDNGLRPMIWEEMILEWHLDFSQGKHGRLGPKPLVQAWRSSEHIAELLEEGFPVIFGDSKHWYLDCGFGVFLDPYPTGTSPPGVPYNTSGGLPSQLEAPYLDYCSPYHNWRSMYMFNPLEGIPDRLQSGIEGGESLMWSEQTDGIDLDFKLWPRAAAAAEVLWAGPREQAMIADATWRLGQWRERIVLDDKIASSPVGMTWCLMEGGCEY